MASLSDVDLRWSRRPGTICPLTPIGQSSQGSGSRTPVAKVIRMLNLRKSLSAAALALCTSPALAGNGRDQLKALPKDAAGVVVVNVEQLAKSPLYQEFYKMAAANSQARRGIAEFGKMVGMDPLITIRALAPALPKGFTDQGLVVLPTGADAKKLELAATQPGMNTKETFQGPTLLKAQDGRTNS